ncbi:tetratricopeptide repeat protein [candidate division KSB1 bacterium]|nr:tetratricopeptide repeat protein [candidate division KSB1 bacterium]
MPVFHSTPWHDITLLDIVQSHLSELDSREYLYIPFDWINQSINQDSVSNPDYRVHFAQRCDYDMLILAYTDSLKPNKINVTFDVYDFHASKRSVYHVEKLLPFIHVDSTLNNTIQTLFQEMGISSLPVAQFSKPKSTDYTKGRYSQLTGDLESAINIFDRAFQKDASDADVRLALCQSLIEGTIEKDDPTNPYNPAFIRSRTLLSALSDSGEHTYPIHQLLALVDVYQEHWNAVENHLRAIWPDEDKNEDPDLLFLLSRLNTARQKTFGYRSKKAILKRIIALNPAHQKAWLDLAQYYFYHNQMKRSENTYLEMLRIHPHCLSAWMGLGKLYLVQDRFGAMIALYEKIVKRWPDSSDVIYNLGLAYHYQDDTQNAVRFFQRAIEIDNHAYSHYFLGIIALNKNQQTEALTHFRQCLISHPQKDDPYVVMSRQEIQKLVASE